MSLRTRLLAPVTAALTGGLVLGVLALAPTPAAAAVPAPVTHTKADQTPTRTVFKRSSYLCYGYQDCKDSGMGNAGYASANDKMYWQMYSGHNCTNYAAYRMVHSGLPNQRPWSGGGNATYWGTSVPRLTDGVPTVGAVAWWKANTGPAGSAGHVAYVEKVVSADEVIVSQDSWHGDFSWAVITRSSGNWPSGFIHFNDQTLVNKTAPVVDGIAKVGSQLTATPGTWKPTDAKVSYQWKADGQPIKKGTGATFSIGRKRIGQVLTVTTTATKLGYPTRSATSAPTAVVLPGVISNTVAPDLGGVAQVESTLTVETGTWDPAPDKLAVQWYADGVAIDGATGPTLALGPDLVDRVITATVTATRSGYDPVTVTTAPSAQVAPGVFKVDREPSITGTPRLGQTLSLDEGAFRPADDNVQVTVQWLRDGEPVLNATGPTYALTALDLGHQMSAQVTLSRAGYQKTTLTAPATTLIRSAPRVVMERTKFKHRVRLLITVTAPSVDEVTGTVVVRVQGGFRQVLTLRHGKAHVSVRDLPKGQRAVHLSYRGSPTVERVTRDGVLWMP